MKTIQYFRKIILCGINSIAQTLIILLHAAVSIEAGDDDVSVEETIALYIYSTVQSAIDRNI
jgi:hypothetical protein